MAGFLKRTRTLPIALGARTVWLSVTSVVLLAVAAGQAMGPIVTVLLETSSIASGVDEQATLPQTGLTAPAAAAGLVRDYPSTSELLAEDLSLGKGATETADDLLPGSSVIPSESTALVMKAVGLMDSLSSYSATGTDTTIDNLAVKEVREQYSVVAPDQAYSRFGTSIRRRGYESIPGQGYVLLDCSLREVILLGATRYQRCQDSDKPSGWTSDSFPTDFQMLSRRSWTRLTWCNGFTEGAEQETVNGVANRVFSCHVPVAREADSIWPSQSLSNQAAKERQRFLDGARIEITVWVRQTDGLISRTFLTRSAPSTVGAIAQTVDYAYSSFGVAPRIFPPT